MPRTTTPSVGRLPSLSIFFPAYNEQVHIADTLKTTLQVAPTVSKKFEIIVIDDGSKDNTGQIVARIAKTHPQVKLITHNPNRGYGEALKTGLYNVEYEWVAFTDSDGQFDFREIENFISKQRETAADLVIGYYKKRQVSQTKILTSKIWEYIIWAMFGLKVRDIDCGFKFFKKQVITQIPKLESRRGAFISSEFLIKAQKAGFKIVETPVTHYPRTGGSGTGRNLDVIINSFLDLFKLWWKLK